MNIFAVFVLVLTGYCLAWAIYRQIMTKYPNWSSRVLALPMMVVYAIGFHWGLTNFNA